VSAAEAADETAEAKAVSDAQAAQKSTDATAEADAVSAAEAADAKTDSQDVANQKAADEADLATATSDVTKLTGEYNAAETALGTANKTIATDAGEITQLKGGLPGNGPGTGPGNDPGTGGAGEPTAAQVSAFESLATATGDMATNMQAFISGNGITKTQFDTLVSSLETKAAADPDNTDLQEQLSEAKAIQKAASLEPGDPGYEDPFVAE